MITEYTVKLRQLIQEVFPIALCKTTCQQYLFPRVGCTKGEYRFKTLLFSRLNKPARVYNDQVGMFSLLYVGPAFLLQAGKQYLGVYLVFGTTETFDIKFCFVIV